MNDHTRQFFVVSSGRCGSTLLSTALQAHEQVLSLSEFFTMIGGRQAFASPTLDGDAFWRLLTTPRADLMSLLHQRQHVAEILARPDDATEASPLPLLLIPLPHLAGDSARIHDELRAEVRGYPTRPTSEQFARLFNWLQVRFNRSCWVERSGGSLDYVDQLVDGFPSAKFVHLSRDGRESALSMSQHPWFRLTMARYLTRDPTLSPDAALQMEIPVERYGAHWSALMIHGARVLSRLPADRVLFLRYDDLVDGGARTLSRLAQFMNLDASEAMVAALGRTARTVRPRWPDLPADAQRRLEHACRPGFVVRDRLEGRDPAGR